MGRVVPAVLVDREVPAGRRRAQADRLRVVPLERAGRRKMVRGHSLLPRKRRLPSRRLPQRLLLRSRRTA
jgi:hypothetical protein